MDNNLVLIQPSEVREIWHKIRPGLIDMVEKGQNPGGWLPEDLFFMALKGEVTIMLIEVGGEDDGFMIVRKVADFDGIRLHIWILHSLTRKDVMSVFSDKLDEIAKLEGCSSTSFSTTRKGWEKIAPKHGYSVHEVVYARSV